jgi:hypothetical protein
MIDTIVVEVDEAEIPFREGDALFSPGAAGKILVIGAVEVIDRDSIRPSRAATQYISTSETWDWSCW